jgi:hypothetical protein
VKLTRLHVYHGIIVALILLAFGIGYYRHGTIVDAAFTTTLVTAITLGSYILICVLDKLLSKPVGKLLCRLGSYKQVYEEIKDAKMRYNEDGNRRGKNVADIKCVRCGKPWVHIVSFRDDDLSGTLYPKKKQR